VATPIGIVARKQYETNLLKEGLLRVMDLDSQ
jgi:hypothetical protein